jgi:hypothetical protein
MLASSPFVLDLYHYLYAILFFPLNCFVPSFIYFMLWFFCTIFFIYILN